MSHISQHPYLDREDHAYKGGGQEAHAQRPRPHLRQLFQGVLPVDLALDDARCHLASDEGGGEGAPGPPGSKQEQSGLLNWTEILWMGCPVWHSS